MYRHLLETAIGIAVGFIGIGLFIMCCGCTVRQPRITTAQRGGPYDPSLVSPPVTLDGRGLKHDGATWVVGVDTDEILIRVPDDFPKPVPGITQEVEIVAVERGFCRPVDCLIVKKLTALHAPSGEWRTWFRRGVRVAIGLRLRPAMDYCNPLQVKRAGSPVRTQLELSERAAGFTCVHQLLE